MPMPVQVPPGHVMQQIVDENGTLRHVILSTQHQQLHSQGGVQPHLHSHYVSSFIRKHSIRFFFFVCSLDSIICCVNSEHVSRRSLHRNGLMIVD